MEDVISDKVDFYCLTYAIGHGVLDELWTKAGKSKELGSFDNIVFKQKDIIHGGWRIWRARQEVKHYKTLPNVYDDYKGASFFERIAGAEFISKELKII